MRKGKVQKRILKPDPRYNDVIVTRFVNNLMLAGKKNKSFQIFYCALDTIKQKTGEDGLDVWKRALQNITPSVEVKSRRLGGANFQIPTEVRPERKVTLGMKWLISFSRKRNEKSMVEKLAGEILAASRNEGAAVKRKEDTHKMAESNRAFSHFKF